MRDKIKERQKAKQIGVNRERGEGRRSETRKNMRKTRRGRKREEENEKQMIAEVKRK